MEALSPKVFPGAPGNAIASTFCSASLFGLKFVIVHYHFRPGGVRRVIELATPSFVAALQPGIDEVVLAAGEGPDREWLAEFRARVSPVPVRLRLDSALGYMDEQKRAPRRIRARLQAFWASLLGPSGRPAIIWAHNPGLGRNLLLTESLARSAKLGTTVLFHHHDWWFDNRWQRWTEMRRAGFRSLTPVAKAILPALPNLRHIAINQADAEIISRHLPGRCGWLPNPAASSPAPRPGAVAAVRGWLQKKVHVRAQAPLWLMPCRLLRRKNIAEALLLTRWLRPEAWLVTTGGASSLQERAYARTLSAAAQQNRWRLRLGVLAGAANPPGLDALIHSSEALLLTSLQEGFGLPYLEAATAGRPLLARSLPNIQPDLDAFGLRFPNLYQEVWIAPVLFEGKAEMNRQTQLFERWRKALPPACRRLACPPDFLAGKTGQPVPFSRLTLTAQLQVLSRPVRVSWEACLPLNPWLTSWKTLAETQRLHPPAWPRQRRAVLQVDNLAHRFRSILEDRPERATAAQGTAAQAEFIRAKLDPHNLYPLTWEPVS